MFRKFACVTALLAFQTSLASSQQPGRVPQTPAELAYSEQVVSLLLKERRYPPAALPEKLEGRAVVFFQVAPDGQIKSRRIVQSSGHAVLDQAALETVDRANPLPPVPAELATTWAGNFAVPINFRLSVAKPIAPDE